MVTSLVCCCYSGGTPHSLDCWISCNVQGKISVGGMVGDSGIVMEDVCKDGMQNLTLPHNIISLREKSTLPGVPGQKRMINSHPYTQFEEILHLHPLVSLIGIPPLPSLVV